MRVEENTSGRGEVEHRGAEHDHSCQWRGLFPSRDVLPMVTRPCPSLTPKLPVKGSIHCFYPTQTLGRFFTSSCLWFSLNLLSRGSPDVSERWRLVTLKTVAVYQRNVIKHFLPLECTKAGPGLSPEPWAGEFCSPQPSGFPWKCGEATWGCWAFCWHQSFLCFLEKCCGCSGI